MGDSELPPMSHEVEEILSKYRAKVEALMLERQKPDMIAYGSLRAELTPEDRYGHLPGIPVGTVFNNRGELAILGLHTQIMRGIYFRSSGPGSGSGALAIVLSGAYKDDEDEGQAFWYTGEGGQKGGKQVQDQVFTNGNLALRTSHETGTPVRVFRGSKEGGKLHYTYEGLYQVAEVQHKPSVDGPLVCRFYMKGVPGESVATSTVGFRSVYGTGNYSSRARPRGEVGPSKGTPKAKKQRALEQGDAGAALDSNQSVKTEKQHAQLAPNSAEISAGEKQRGRLAPTSAEISAGEKQRRQHAPNSAEISAGEKQRGQLAPISADISGGLEASTPIPLFNEVDGELLDPGFVYISDYEFAPQLQAQVKEVLERERLRLCQYTRPERTGGCMVEFREMIHEADMKWNENIKVFDWAEHPPPMQFLVQRRNYAESGCLLNTEPCGVHECAPHCSRTAECRTNRQVTNGIHAPLEVFRTVDKGWGVRCSEPLATGAFVCCYIGQLVSEATMQRMIRAGKDRYALRLNFFTALFKDMYDNGLDSVEGDAPAHKIPPHPQLPFPAHLMKADGGGHVQRGTADTPTVSSEDYQALLSVDAATRGNVARFINHSCDANMEIQGVFAKDARSVVLYYIAFFTTRPVPARTELTFNYASHKAGFRADRGVRCSCGAQSCRGTLI